VIARKVSTRSGREGGGFGMASDAEVSRGWTVMRGAVAEKSCKPAFEAPRGHNATTDGTTLNRHSWSDRSEWIDAKWAETG
jgi:hypothetical protein